MDSSFPMFVYSWYSIAWLPAVVIGGLAENYMLDEKDKRSIWIGLTTTYGVIPIVVGLLLDLAHG